MFLFRAPNEYPAGLLNNPRGPDINPARPYYFQAKMYQIPCHYLPLQYLSRSFSLINCTKASVAPACFMILFSNSCMIR